MKQIKDTIASEFFILDENMDIVYSTLNDVHLSREIVENLYIIQQMGNGEYISNESKYYKIKIEKSLIGENPCFIVTVKDLDTKKCIGDTNCKRVMGKEKKEILKKCIEVVRGVLNNMTHSENDLTVTHEILDVSQHLDELITLYMKE